MSKNVYFDGLDDTVDKNNKDYTSNWSEEVFVIRKIKNTVT